MWETYNGQVQFFVVYIREAHPIDGRSPLGGNGMPIVEDPVSIFERNQVASVCMTRLALEPMPALVDGVDDAEGKAYAGAPGSPVSGRPRWTHRLSEWSRTVRLQAR